MNKLLESKYPYLTNFFRTSIEQNRLFHSIILYGSNNLIQYAMALELARQLNCLEDGREDCNCQNCRWIRANQHPSVMTVSKIDNKTDDSKTVISEVQINNVLDALVNSSDYHRVFIFCDAEMKTLTANEEKEYIEFQETGYKAPQEENDGKKWYPSGVNGTCLQAVAANEMLKTIEEPPSNTTFIFLTNNKDDLIQTIVSRSQTFFVPDTKNIQYSTDFFKRFFENYPDFNKNQALDFALFLYEYQTKNSLEPKYILDCMQYYLTELIKSNYENKQLINIAYKDIKKIENSKKMIDSYIKENTVYEDLAFYLCKR